MEPWYFSGDSTVPKRDGKRNYRLQMVGNFARRQQDSNPLHPDLLQKQPRGFLRNFMSWTSKHDLAAYLPDPLISETHKLN